MRLDTSYNTASINYINDKFKGMKLENKSQEKSPIHQENAHFRVMSSAYDEPHNFREARNQEYPEEPEGCYTSILNEFKDMINKRVHGKPRRINMPSNIRLIDLKYVFKKKRNGKLGECLVAWWYTQFPGE